MVGGVCKRGIGRDRFWDPGLRLTWPILPDVTPGGLAVIRSLCSMGPASLSGGKGQPYWEALSLLISFPIM